MSGTKVAPNLPQWMKDHTALYLSSGGSDGHMYKVAQPGGAELTVPSLLLTTTGSITGEKYLLPLFYGQTGDSYFVIASKGGGPKHPSWYRNILASPEVEIQVGTTKMRARARTAVREERERLWEQAVKFFPPYADYKLKATDRQIPVVVLDPVVPDVRP
jgi:F420H(2)-dependent quinone reductase